MNKLNKKTLIIIGVILLLLCVIGLWQLALIALGVMALSFALKIIKSDFAYNGPCDDEEIKLDMIDEHDKEIKDNSNYSKDKYSKREEIKKVIKGFKLTSLEKAVIIAFSIFALIMIVCIVVVTSKKNDTPFEVTESDELVMTDEEREANKKKKQDTENALKEANEKEKEEKEKAEEEKKEKEEEEKTEDKDEKDLTPIDDSIPQVKDTSTPEVSQENTEVKDDIYQN